MEASRSIGRHQSIVGVADVAASRMERANRRAMIDVGDGSEEPVMDGRMEEIIEVMPIDGLLIEEAAHGVVS